MLEVTSLLPLFKADLFVHLKCLSVCLQMKSFKLFPSLISFLYKVFLKDQGNEPLEMIRILLCLTCVFEEHTLRFLPICYKWEYVFQSLLSQKLFHKLDMEIMSIFLFNLQCFLIIVSCRTLMLIILYLVLTIQIRMIIKN